MTRSLYALTCFALIAVALPETTVADKVYVSSTALNYLVEADTESGNRRFFDLEDYPRIIDWEEALVDQDGTVLIETWDAQQRVGVHRLNPVSEAVTPISGGVDGFASGLLGAGPAINPTIVGLARRHNRLVILRRHTGVMEINLQSSDRRIVSQSVGEPVGQGPPLEQPVDVVYDPRGRLLVWDNFQGLFHIDETSGDRTVLLTTGDLGMPARCMDVLPDGRLIFSPAIPEVLALWTLDLATGEVTLFSGSFGGISAGSGPEFLLIADMVVGPRGEVWVYDSGLQALFRVGLKGDRTIVSSETVGEGLPFPSAAERPRMAPLYRPLAIDTAEGWELR